MRAMMLFTLILLLILVPFAGSCQRVTPPRVGELHIEGLGNPRTLDPHLVDDATSAQYVMEIFGGLVTILPNLEIIPDIAERWERSEDETVYTFYLRRNAKFHDSRPVTAEDIKYSFERATDPKSFKVPKNIYLAELFLKDIVGVEDKLKGRTQQVRGVEVLDEHTLRITIEKPSYLFLSRLTFPIAFVVDRTQVENDPESFKQKPNGTGPFRLVERTLDRIVLERNINYHFGPPQIERVVSYTTSPHPWAYIEAYEQGEYDVVAHVNPSDAADLHRWEDPLCEELQSVERFATVAVILNTQIAPFDDLKVRQALSTSIDRDLMADIFNGSPAYSIIPPSLPQYVSYESALSYQPKKARQLIGESKYSGEFPPVVMSEVGIWASINTTQVPIGSTIVEIRTPSLGHPSLVAQSLAGMWKTDLGLDIVPIVVDPGTFIDEVRRRQLQAVLYAWDVWYPDPEEFLYLPFYSKSSINWSSYSNSTVDRLLELASQATDNDTRLRLYAKAEEAIVRDAPWIPLFHPKDTALVKPWVQGWKPTPVPLPKLHYVMIDEDRRLAELSHGK